MKALKYLSSGSSTKLRLRLLKILQATAVTLALLICLAFLASWSWTMSGSNQWQLKIDKDGTQVYTLKSPGSATIKVRGVWQSKEFTLSNHLAPFFDESMQEDCTQWVPSCLGFKILKPWDPRTERNVTMWTLGLFPPLAPREILVQGRLSQDPVTKVVTIENVAVPNSLPRNDCCVRVEHFHNVWHYTQLQDGAIKVQFLSDWEMGGAFPKILANLGAPAEVHKMLSRDNPKLLRQAKYRTAHFDFIDESYASAH